MRKVAVLLGSKSDEQAMSACVEYLGKFGIPHELRVSSAHRQPEETASFVKSAEAQGYGVIIAAAGMAAHLAGFAAAHTMLPVIGVPLDGSALGGVDALYSTVQMPAGIPVATVAIGGAGAKNAAVLAAEILALNDEVLRAKLVDFRKAGAKF
ncbi:MAG TPA: 5-(carboxyamino)imidazole ribonucleotide mutase [Bacteroidota bacterium]|nr:5-(carboxyamino)imidazole ribonucleotide mutase [Bacteroidota bacterium]